MLRIIVQRSPLLVFHHIKNMHHYKLLPGGQNYASTRCSGSGLVEALATQSQNCSVNEIFFFAVASVGMYQSNWRISTIRDCRKLL